MWGLGGFYKLGTKCSVQQEAYNQPATNYLQTWRVTVEGCFDVSVCLLSGCETQSGHIITLNWFDAITGLNRNTKLIATTVRTMNISVAKHQVDSYRYQDYVHQCSNTVCDLGGKKVKYFERK